MVLIPNRDFTRHIMVGRYSESAQYENTETSPLRSLTDLQRLENFFPRLQISEKVDMFTQFI